MAAIRYRVESIVRENLGPFYVPIHGLATIATTGDHRYSRLATAAI